MSEFPHLLAPGHIGSLALRNRILMAPMGDSLANPDGTISEAQLAYFEARARGGAALLLVGSVAVAYPDGCVDERQVAASLPEHDAGLRALADRVHAHGATVAAQLTYNGALARLDIARGRPMLVPGIPPRPRPDALSMMVTDDEMAAFMAPYAVPGARADYKIADDTDIAQVVTAFVAATDRCRRAGIDGVELHAGHGYLIDEFLSPAVNTRTDAWGGNSEGRSRLLIEIIRAIRERVGRDYPLWMRINALEHHKANGERFVDQLDIIERAVDAGLDAVHVTAYSSLDVATGPTDSYAPHRVGDLADYAGRVRARVPVPVVTFGRFEPDEAEAVLAAGQADFIAMGRKLLADPELPTLLAAGTPERIRPCLYQYRCIGNIFVNGSLACVANAATGREHEAEIPTARARRRVLVVGGGAAGLEVARVLADQGHAVELVERSGRLGGVLDAIAGVDETLDRQRRWLIAEVERRSVVVRLRTTLDSASLAAAAPDALVLATGPEWVRPEVDGAGRVLTPPELEDPGATASAVGPTVVVLGGGKPALTLAVALCGEARTVALVTDARVLAPELGVPGRFRLVADAQAAGVALHTETRLTAISESDVCCEGPAGTIAIPAATVIATDRTRSATGDLVAAAESLGLPVTVVGDARDPRGFEGITRDAEDLARQLAG